MKIVDKFYGFIGKLYQNHMRSISKKNDLKEMSQLEKDRMKLYQQLRDLYEFVKWINTKGLPNRHARKAFWYNVAAGQPLVENMIDDMAKKLSITLEDAAKQLQAMTEAQRLKNKK
jgi:hypothetical protein